MQTSKLTVNTVTAQIISSATYLKQSTSFIMFRCAPILPVGERREDSALKYSEPNRSPLFFIINKYSVYCYQFTLFYFFYDSYFGFQNLKLKFFPIIGKNFIETFLSILKLRDAWRLKNGFFAYIRGNVPAFTHSYNKSRRAVQQTRPYWPSDITFFPLNMIWHCLTFQRRLAGTWYWKKETLSMEFVTWHSRIVRKFLNSTLQPTILNNILKNKYKMGEEYN